MQKTLIPNQPSKTPHTFVVSPTRQHQLALTNNHSFFLKHGISPEIVERFDLGFCDEGPMKDRIVVPIHNYTGQLVAYCGMAVTPEQAKAHGKYRFTKIFHKSDVIYNLHRQGKALTKLFLVRNITLVWKLYEEGFHNVVALMEESLSEAQENVILNFLPEDGRIFLVLSANKNGLYWGKDWLFSLARKRKIGIIDINNISRFKR